MVASGDFRMDLFYRLNVFPIHVPSLRERTEDLPELSKHIMQQLSKKLAKPCPNISDESIRHLSAYPWPGNVRELQNILEREMILSNQDTLSISSLLPSSNVNPHTTYLLASVEQDHIIKVLEHCQWKIGGNQGAAQLLGLPDSTLRSKMTKLGITRPK